MLKRQLLAVPFCLVLSVGTVGSQSGTLLLDLRSADCTLTSTGLNRCDLVVDVENAGSVPIQIPSPTELIYVVEDGLFSVEPKVWDPIWNAPLSLAAGESATTGLLIELDSNALGFELVADFDGVQTSIDITNRIAGSANQTAFDLLTSPEETNQNQPAADDDGVAPLASVTEGLENSPSETSPEADQTAPISLTPVDATVALPNDGIQAVYSANMSADIALRLVRVAENDEALVLEQELSQRNALVDFGPQPAGQYRIDLVQRSGDSAATVLATSDVIVRDTIADDLETFNAATDLAAPLATSQDQGFNLLAHALSPEINLAPRPFLNGLDAENMFRPNRDYNPGSTISVVDISLPQGLQAEVDRLLVQPAEGRWVFPIRRLGLFAVNDDGTTQFLGKWSMDGVDEYALAFDPQELSRIRLIFDSQERYGGVATLKLISAEPPAIAAQRVVTGGLAEDWNTTDYPGGADYAAPALGGTIPNFAEVGPYGAQTEALLYSDRERTPSRLCDRRCQGAQAPSDLVYEIGRGSPVTIDAVRVTHVVGRFGAQPFVAPGLFEVMVSNTGSPDDYDSVGTFVARGLSETSNLLRFAPIQARFVKLRVLRMSEPAAVRLVDVAILGPVEHVPTESVNVLDWRLGGHVARFSGQVTSEEGLHGSVMNVLAPSVVDSFWVPGDNTTEPFVIAGFADGRPAWIDRLVFDLGEDEAGPAQQAIRVRLQSTMQTPISEFVPLMGDGIDDDGIMRLNPGGQQTVVQLASPIEARYLRFDFLGNKGRIPTIPGHIEAFGPQRTDGVAVTPPPWILVPPAQAQSRLLGQSTSELSELDVEPLTSEVEPNNDAASAQPIAADVPVLGSIGPAERDIYRLSVTERRAIVEIGLQGLPRLDMDVRVVAEPSGRLVDGLATTYGSNQTLSLSGELEAGQYRIELDRSQSQLAIAYDLSGSMEGNIHSLIEGLSQSLLETAPHQNISLIGFGGSLQPLSEEIPDDPSQLLNSCSLSRDPAWQAHVQETGFQDSLVRRCAQLEAIASLQAGRCTPLYDAIDSALNTVDTNAVGGAVIVFTDGVHTCGNVSLSQSWEILEANQTPIFGIALGEEMRHFYIDEFQVPKIGASGFDLLNSFARASGGASVLLSQSEDLSQAFHQVREALDRPVEYRLSLAIQPIVQGGLRFENIAQAVEAQSERLSLVPNIAASIIVDASGSMRQRVDGEDVRRFTLARDSVLDVVSSGLPRRLPTSLWVFGLGGEGSCDVSEVVPLSPLYPFQFEEALEPIWPVNLARTPIADSLLAAGASLAAEEVEKRFIILLTDGEETCDGDPEAAIRILRSQGIDITINIVGFAIDDEGVRQDFERWALLGGGRYFDARDRSTLRQAMIDAAADVDITTDDVALLVVDQDGNEMAAGQIGDTLAVEAGIYDVFFNMPSLTLLPNVEVEPGETSVYDVSEWYLGGGMLELE